MAMSECRCGDEDELCLPIPLLLRSDNADEAPVAAAVAATTAAAAEALLLKLSASVAITNVC